MFLFICLYNHIYLLLLSQDLYSDAISIIGDAFEDVIDVMNEKEIRIRLPTEELEILLEEVK